MLHEEVVLLRIYGRHHAPIAILVPGQERGGVLAGTREEGEWLGMVMSHLGRVPKVSDSFEWEGFSFEVVDMDGHRVDKVLVQKA